MLRCRVVTRRTKTAPMIFDFNVRMAANLNKIAEDYLKKQMDKEESEAPSVNGSSNDKSNNAP